MASSLAAPVVGSFVTVKMASGYVRKGTVSAISDDGWITMPSAGDPIHDAFTVYLNLAQVAEITKP